MFTTDTALIFVKLAPYTNIPDTQTNLFLLSKHSVVPDSSTWYLERTNKSFHKYRMLITNTSSIAYLHISTLDFKQNL